jgi:hypothetical protein
MCKNEKFGWVIPAYCPSSVQFLPGFQWTVDRIPRSDLDNTFKIRFPWGFKKNLYILYLRRYICHGESIILDLKSIWISKKNIKKLSDDLLLGRDDRHVVAYSNNNQVVLLDTCSGNRDDHHVVAHSNNNQVVLLDTCSGNRDDYHVVALEQRQPGGPAEHLLG